MLNLPVLSFDKEYSVQLEDCVFSLLLDKPRIQHTGKDALQPMIHSHNFSEFFYCTKGEIFLKIDKETIVIKSGDAAVIPSGIPHYQFPVSEGIEGYTVSFLCHKRTLKNSAKLYHHILPYLVGSEIIIFRNRIYLKTLLESIISESAEGQTIFPAMHMLEILLQLASGPVRGEAGKPKDIVKNNSRDRDIQRMMNLDLLICTAYMNNITLNDIARELYISSRQLSRLVKEQYGKTLHRVIMEKRMIEAEQMLLHTDMTVEQIGLSVGFASRSGFYREIFNRHGVTPAEFRNNRQRHN